MSSHVSPHPATPDANPAATPVGIGLLGLGTVGTGVYKRLSALPQYHIPAAAVRDALRKRSVDLPPGRLTTDVLAVVNRPDVQVVVEVMGGVDTAKEAVFTALANKKHVVTANKELIAKHGPELFALARQNNVRLLFEGAVAGGIPIIMPLKLSLAGNRIEEIAGILNGTTNFILTHMTQKGADYAEVLKQAQDLGFAEADPTSDVEGFDTGYKISILASLAFQQHIPNARIYREGITRITAEDIRFADELGYIVKLLGLARQPSAGDRVDVRVHPALIPKSHPMAHIHFENNAVWVKGDAVGDVMFYGKGAGEMPTASAVMGDVLAIGSELLRGNDPIPLMDVCLSGEADLLPVDETENRYYIRLNASDEPGVVGRLGTAFGDCGVSLESVLQKGIRENGTATIVLMTHRVPEANIRRALETMRRDNTMRGEAGVIRVLS